MRTSHSRLRLAAVAAVLVLGSAGCGSGGDGPTTTGAAPAAVGATDGAPATAPATAPDTAATPGTGSATTPGAQAAATSSFRTLANAVCRAEVSGVPPVPDPRTPDAAAQGRRYASAVEKAAQGLADAFVQLERRRPESQDALGPLVTRARTVVRSARTARSAREGASESGGFQDEIRVAIALLNEASSAAGLPTCAL